MQEPQINKVLCGKSQETLKEYPDNFFDNIITDPPYELGFMSKKWDASGIAYNVKLWKEVLRVAKPGAYLFCFGGTRTFHRVACAIEDAGFLIKDQMMWIYGNGFPKSTNISKQIDKEAGAKRKKICDNPNARIAQQNYSLDGSSKNFSATYNDITAPATNAAKQWDGYGTALKPAWEPIIMAMKPIEEGLTYAQNAQKHGVAGLNIDGGRIGTEIISQHGRTKDDFGFTSPQEKGQTWRGRWPANVILSHSPDCVCIGTKTINEGALAGGYTYSGKEYKVEGFVKDCKPQAPSNRSQETIDVWACTPDCPVRIMDTQSGQSSSSSRKLENKPREAKRHGNALQLNSGGSKWIDGMGGGHEDSGGASRFFYTAKACRNEREAGLIEFIPCDKCGSFDSKTHTIDGVKENCIRNTHPTVKPLAVMSYLIKLITMPQSALKQIILDPFCGSGTTLVAAEHAKLNYVGIDQDIDSVLIASSRIGTYKDETVESICKEKADTKIDIADLDTELSSEDFADLIA